MRGEEGFSSKVLENPLETRERTVHGVIDSSLFEAVAKAGAHDQTALALAEIFGWDIDFVLDIQPGDSFIATYDEISQDGSTSRTARSRPRCSSIRAANTARSVSWIPPAPRTITRPKA